MHDGETIQYLTYCDLCGDEFYSDGSDDPCADCLQEARNIALALASDPEQLEEEPTVTAADASLIAANITVATAERALLDLIYRRDALILAGELTEEIEREMAIASKALELERFNRDNIAVDNARRTPPAVTAADDAPGDEGEPMSAYNARLLRRMIAAGYVNDIKGATAECVKLEEEARLERERTYDLRDDWAEEMQLRAVSA